MVDNLARKHVTCYDSEKAFLFSTIVVVGTSVSAKRMNFSGHNIWRWVHEVFADHPGD